MATLTPEQTDFLTSHKIPLDKTFDASGLSSKDYKAKMKQNGTLVAFGVPPCAKGHTLRNKQANCIQCNPQAIASIKRQATAGDVYIAVSPSQLLTKISVCENATTIIEQLNAENHAQINDWQQVLLGKTDSIGQLENHLQQRLAERQLPKKLTQGSKTTKASQIYDLDIDEAIDILNEYEFTLTHLDTQVLENFHQAYQQNALQRQAEQEQLTQAKRAEQQAQQLAEMTAKQAKLDAQQQQQQRAKAQKAEQKRLRQQQLMTKKQKQATKPPTNHPSHTNNNNTSLVTATTTDNQTLHKTPSSNPPVTAKPAFFMAKKQRNVMIGFAIAGLVVLILILIALLKR